MYKVLSIGRASVLVFRLWTQSVDVQGIIYWQGQRVCDASPPKPLPLDVFLVLLESSPWRVQVHPGDFGMVRV
jgi:hypothetical protein